MKSLLAAILFLFVSGITAEEQETKVTKEEDSLVWTFLTRDPVLTQRFRNGQYEEVMEIAKKHPQDFYDIAKRWFKRTIDKKEYNIPGCLLFSFPENKGLAALNLSANVYPLLYEQMLEDGFDDSTYMVTLAYHVKLCIEHRQFQHLSEESQTKLDNLKHRFAFGIQALMWNEAVTIRSVLNEDFVLQGDSPGQLYTKAQTNNFTSWSVRTFKTSQKTLVVYFSFENTETGLVPYSETSEARLGKHVFDEIAYWKLIPVEHATSFLFQNKFNDRYLDANGISTCGDVQCTRTHTYYRVSANKKYQQWVIE